MRQYLLLAAAAAILSAPSMAAPSAKDRAALEAAVKADHAAAVKRLQDWIALPTIAAENLNAAAGAEYMRRLALDAGFSQAKVIPTSGVPGVLATLDAGARDCVGVYFMYDVKQYDPAEWSSPVARLAAQGSEEDAKKGSGGVGRWINDEDYRTSLERLISQPTINIQGLVSGYMGRAARPYCPAAPRPRSTCAWSPTRQGTRSPPS